MNEEVVTQEVVQESNVPVETTQSHNSVENNLVALRKKLEAEESARKAAERRAQELEQRTHSISSPQTPVPVEEEDIQIDNEDYVQAKHVKSSTNKLKTKLSATEQRIAELEQKLSYMQAQREVDALPDFYKVVNDDNIKTFARLYPEDYECMMANPNLSARSKTAYNMIKNYGIIQQIDTSHNQERILANQSKPKAAASVAPQSAQTPLTKVGEYERRVLTDADKDRINQMLQARKNMG
jgi:hypothetical protein